MKTEESIWNDQDLDLDDKMKKTYSLKKYKEIIESDFYCDL